GAAADLLAVDVDRVHLLNDAEFHGVAAAGAEPGTTGTARAAWACSRCRSRCWGRVRLGHVEGLAEVDECGSVGNAELSESAGNGDLFPTGVVVIRRGPMLLHADVVL